MDPSDEVAEVAEGGNMLGELQGTLGGEVEGDSAAAVGARALSVVGMPQRLEGAPGKGIGGVSASAARGAMLEPGVRAWLAGSGRAATQLRLMMRLGVPPGAIARMRGREVAEDGGGTAPSEGGTGEDREHAGAEGGGGGGGTAWAGEVVVVWDEPTGKGAVSSFVRSWLAVRGESGSVGGCGRRRTGCTVANGDESDSGREGSPAEPAEVL